jgi:hypothetical protein
MILPYVIIVLILVCAYLEYQKNINMNNKVVICIICILTFVLCMGFVEQFKNREEGFQGSGDIYAGSDLESVENQEICEKKERERSPDPEDDKLPTYGNEIPFIKLNSYKRDLLKKYIERKKNGENVCWKFENYIKCDAIKNKPDKDKTEDDIRDLDTDGICTKTETDCIEEKMIATYYESLEKDSYDDIKKQAMTLSIKIKDKDKETLINEIKNKKILKNILQELRLTDDDYASKLLKQTEEFITKSKSGLCKNCGLEGTTCDTLLQIANGEITASEAVAKSNAIAEANALEAQLKAQKEKLDKEKKIEIAKAIEQAKAEKEKLEKELTEAQGEIVNNSLTSNSIGDIFNSENATANNATTVGNNATTATAATTGNNATSNTNSHNNNNNMQNNHTRRAQIYINPMSSGHILDKYYSSLDNKPPGYSYLDPRMWTVPQKRPPVCHYNNELSAVPLYDTGTHINVLELTPYGDIATSENAVKETNVGSIMPKFQYREFNN